MFKAWDKVRLYKIKNKNRKKFLWISEIIRIADIKKHPELKDNWIEYIYYVNEKDFFWSLYFSWDELELADELEEFSRYTKARNSQDMKNILKLQENWIIKIIDEEAIVKMIWDRKIVLAP